MKLKPDASLKGVQWQMFVAAIIFEAILKSWGVECVITSGTDGKHMKNGLHPKGLALDFRRKDLQPTVIQMVAQELRNALGPDYDVVVEVDHFHVEYQPKGVKV